MCYNFIIYSRVRRSRAIPYHPPSADRWGVNSKKVLYIIIIRIGQRPLNSYIRIYVVCIASLAHVIYILYVLDILCTRVLRQSAHTNILYTMCALYNNHRVVLIKYEFICNVYETTAILKYVEYNIIQLIPDPIFIICIHSNDS